MQSTSDIAQGSLEVRHVGEARCKKEQGEETAPQREREREREGERERERERARARARERDSTKQ